MGYCYDCRSKQAFNQTHVAGDSASDAKGMKTPDLHKKTVELLKSRKFGPARAFLDELSQRRDNKKGIPSAKSLGLSGPYAEILEDRIDLVNSKTARCVDPVALRIATRKLTRDL